MKRMAGFTLLEVLASLALLALLMAGVYAGIRTATHSVHAGSAKIERLDQIRAAQQWLRRELAQTMAQTISRRDDGSPQIFFGTAHEMRYVAPLPGYLGKLGPQLQRLSLVDGGEDGWRLELSLAVLPPDGQPAQPLADPQVLVDHIRSGHFSYRGIDAQRRAGAWQDDWPDDRQLPRLVRIELELSDRHSWPLLEIPLRVEPIVGNRQGRAQSVRMQPAGAL
ncbi:MAG: prepilin-type N-terminal cleavage/methylation domain-containing protein [Rhodanobacter sp.]